jgi:hypothetical protein
MAWSQVNLTQGVFEKAVQYNEIMRSKSPVEIDLAASSVFTLNT